MKKFVYAALALCLACNVAQAQPGSFTNLGIIGDTSAVYNVADLSFTTPAVSTSNIQWFQFEILDSTSASGFFFDIDLFSTGASGQVDSEIGIYDNSGNRIADDDDDGHSLRSALTFGNTTARTMPPDPFGWTNGLAANGRDGNLAAGIYWLAVGQFNVTFGNTGWNVTSNGTGAGSAVTINFRTDIPGSTIPEPATAALLAGLGIVGLTIRRRK